MVFIAILFYAYEYFLRVAPSVMTDFYMREYSLNMEEVALIATYYYYAYTPLQLFVGPITDTYGVRKLLLISILSCVIGSAVCAYNAGFNLTLVARFLIGFGSSFAFVAVLKTTREWLPEKYFPPVAGITTSIGMLGAITSQTALPSLIGSIGEIESMWYVTIVGCVLWIISFRYVADRPSAKPKVAKNTFKNLFMSLYHVMKIPQIWVVGVIGAAMYMPTTIFSDLWAPRFFEDVDHIPHAISGVLSSMLYWGWIIGSPLVGLLSSYIGKRRVILNVCSLISALLIAGVIYYPTNDPYIIGAAMLLMGIFSSAQVLIFAIANDNVDKEHTGTAVAVTNMLVMTSGFLQPYVGRQLTEYAYNSAAFSAEGFRQALMVMPSALLLAFLLTFMLKEKASDAKTE